jgi:hypothetical protein
METTNEVIQSKNSVEMARVDGHVCVYNVFVTASSMVLRFCGNSVLQSRLVSSVTAASAAPVG